MCMCVHIDLFDRGGVTIYTGACMQIKDLNMVLSAVTDLERIQITPEDLLVSHTTSSFPLLLTLHPPHHTLPATPSHSLTACGTAV